MDSNGEGGASCHLTLTNTRVKFIVIIITELLFKGLSIQTDHSPAKQFDCAKRTIGLCDNALCNDIEILKNYC